MERLHLGLVADDVGQLLYVLLCKLHYPTQKPRDPIPINGSPASLTHPPTQIASYGTEVLGMSFSSASLLVIVINGVGFPFRVLVPLLADRFGPLNTLVPVTAIWSVIAFCWLGVTTIPGFFVWTAFYGALSASLQCLIATAVTSITPRLDMVGTRMGMAFGIISFAAMTGPPVGGALKTAQHDDFTWSQIWAAAALLAGCLFCTAAKFIKTGWRSNLMARC